MSSTSDQFQVAKLKPNGGQSPASRCVRCGALAVRLRRRPGRTTRYRNMPALSIPENLPIPTCHRCAAEYIDLDTAPQLNEVLADLYRKQLRRRIVIAIDRVTKHISQRRLELLLSLSQGYLSRLRGGEYNPSPELVSHLALIAHDPPARLLELQKYWADPDGMPPVQAEPI